MMRTPPVNPLDPNRCIGTICEVGQTTARMILSDAAAESAEVGRFVVIECGEFPFFARVTDAGRQPESDRGPATIGSGGLEFLTAMISDGENGRRGLIRFPHPGSRVYSAPPELLRWLFVFASSFYVW